MARRNKKKIRSKLSATISAHLFACCRQKSTSLKYSLLLLFPHSFPLLFPILSWCEALQWLSPKLLSLLPYLDLHCMQLDGLYFKTAVWRDLATSSWLHASNKIWQIPGPMIWWHILSFQWAFPILITNNFTSAIMPLRVMKKLIWFWSKQWIGFCTSYKQVNWLLGVLESWEILVPDISPPCVVCVLPCTAAPACIPEVLCWQSKKTPLFKSTWGDFKCCDKTTVG